MSKKELLIIIGSILVAPVFARIDTIYYNREGKGVPDKVFADYYRVALVPADSSGYKIFRDFYMSGKIKGEGQYESIDKNDDNKTVLTGEVKTYFENGLLSSHAFLNNGLREGIYTQFYEDGTTYSQLEYHNGKPVTDYYILANKDGLMSKFSLEDGSPIWESPTLDEKQTRFVDGNPWAYYNKNGMYVSMTLSKVKDYGKYYRVDLVLANNTMGPVEFEPGDIDAVLTDKDGFVNNLKVFTAEQYIKKVERRQNFAMAMTAVATGLAAAGTGYSTATSNTYYYGRNGGGFATTTTTAYNSAAVMQSSIIAGQALAEMDKSMADDRAVKDQGYLKLTTIEPGDAICGYVLIERKPGTDINVFIDVYGASYEFPWVLK